MKTPTNTSADQRACLATADREIWIAAGLMIQEYGNQAVIQAAIRAEEASAAADMDNVLVWKRVARAIAEFTNTDGITAH